MVTGPLIPNHVGEEALGEAEKTKKDSVHLWGGETGTGNVGGSRGWEFCK